MSIMRTDRKPPLARSPMRLRPRRILRSTPTNVQLTPPGSLTKTQLPNRPSESELRPEYHTISYELRALAKMVENEFGDPDLGNAAFGSKSRGISMSSPLFERGRFYEEYSARRNERLKRKKGDTGDDERKKNAYGLGVKVEWAKKRDSKRLEGLRKSVFSTPVITADWKENPRYLLRSMTKENKKPPLPPVGGGGERKTAARRVRKI
ncbi:uncharacterized protein LOC131330841 [Rhododendron vialii]|uniref:uncharacterized protein LOC131330841 n=1 Tax=Rhododendron vialii TaxID=182163 RepID=UPI00265E95BE|nr:uncharacterized protein LOC131330841 [Rhododendron vialii]